MLVWRNLLLTLHLLFIIIWLGGAFRTMLSRRSLARARGTPHELALIRADSEYGIVTLLAIFLVALTGILMSIVTDRGFFQVFWLGIKQAIMLAILVVVVTVSMPLARRIRYYARTASANPGEVPEPLRATLARMWFFNNLIDIGALVNLLLAVWKPS